MLKGPGGFQKIVNGSINIILGNWSGVAWRNILRKTNCTKRYPYRGRRTVIP
jgi:hypothetical protein